MVYVTDHLMTRSLAVMNGDKRKCVLGTFAYREGSDQPAQTHRLTRVFDVHLHNNWSIKHVKLEQKS